MINILIALYSWTNGVVMIAIFALVCITLVGILINFLASGKKKDDSKYSLGTPETSPKTMQGPSEIKKMTPESSLARPEALPSSPNDPPLALEKDFQEPAKYF